MGFYREVTVSISDFDDDDVIEYAKELMRDSDDDDIIEEVIRNEKGFLFPKDMSMVNKEKFQFFIKNYENLNLEDLENLI